MQVSYNGLGEAVHYTLESCDSLEDVAAIMHCTKDELVKLIQDIVDQDQKANSKESE